jgi:hypothetical protein
MKGTIIQVEKLNDRLIFAFEAKGKRLSCDSLMASDFANDDGSLVRFQFLPGVGRRTVSLAQGTAHGSVSRDAVKSGHAWMFHAHNGNVCWEGDRDTDRLYPSQFTLGSVLTVETPAAEVADRMILRWFYTLRELPFLAFPQQA